MPLCSKTSHIPLLKMANAPRFTSVCWEHYRSLDNCGFLFSKNSSPKGKRILEILLPIFWVSFVNWKVTLVIDRHWIWPSVPHHTICGLHLSVNRACWLASEAKNMDRIIKSAPWSGHTRLASVLLVESLTEFVVSTQWPARDGTYSSRHWLTEFYQPGIYELGWVFSLSETVIIHQRSRKLKPVLSHGEKESPLSQTGRWALVWLCHSADIWTALSIDMKQDFLLNCTQF